ncbi:hypothetical protein FNV43_RR23914 [Rhamnella rubrinervis]|uniref:Uncharacterized protein n=1 Tax=Rhamnella rubrinervis TaxID=2594499 RepID=A0A8K0DKJ0_9ROSA|nr:hypothetical protein FNV43_RR23914 [Rhamnella rubrinervis]
MSSERGKKRRLMDDDDEKVYRFKILLPDGIAVVLNIRDPPHPKLLLMDFIELVKVEYFRVQRHSKFANRRTPINWKGGGLYLEDANDVKMKHAVNLEKFKPHKCHILRLHDGSGQFAQTFENMWDLTPDTDLLNELPEEYTFETALADLIDNSLQAVWSNDENDRRLISVDVSEDIIRIFDTGPGMDGSDKNSIVKWGKMGASLHRSSKGHAIGGKPPYLKPFFGMFGYGGPIASMHLGRHALVSSKTKESQKVYQLHLEREALLNNSGSEHTWKTKGGIRNPLEDELKNARHGSFTKVEIFEPRIKCLDVFQLQCKLKDIYFPYIQCDEGGTLTPIEFQVNGVDLAEVEGGEVAVTNLHSCNGENFVLQLHFLSNQESEISSQGSRAYLEANARLKCVYFPVVKGKENIERILEKLEHEGCRIPENYETFSRVSIRRLGRLLPDARWAWLPFMEFKHKKGDKAHLLKMCCQRVKCFIETDAGFNPTPSKTDLAHHNPFTTALRNFGNKFPEKEKGITVKIYRGGKLLNPLQVEREYQDWILSMHDQHDEETEHGEDQPVVVVSPANKKAIHISSDVIRVHKALNRKGVMWKSGQKIKILKGACAGVHKNNVYATIDCFVLEGLEGDSGGGSRIICRPLGIAKESGCILSETDGETNIDVRNSLSIPITVIDSGKCIAIESIEWEYQLVKWHQKSPSTIDLLSEMHCRDLEVDGALPINSYAGTVLPKETVAVVRPASYVSSSASKNLDQKHIFKSNLEMSMQVNFRGAAQDRDNVEHIYSVRLKPSSRKGIQGLYVFPLRCKLPSFDRAGIYTFTFSLIDSSCKTCERTVLIKASDKVGSWRFLSNNQSQPYTVRVGSTFQPLPVACYDIYGNQIPFTSNPEVMLKIQTSEVVIAHVKKLKTSLSASKMTLKVENVLIESSELDKIRPTYAASVIIYTQDESLSVSTECQVVPGCLHHVEVQCPYLENQLLPGCTVKEFKLEMFDNYGNHVKKDLDVQLKMEGFFLQDQLGLERKVDNDGYIDLSGLLKVTAGYGKDVSLSVLSGKKVVLKKEYQIEKRELRMVSKVPELVAAGTQLENIIFEVVNSEGGVDETIHNEEKNGQSHLLTIKAESCNSEDLIRYTFKHGRCIVLSIPLPHKGGAFCFVASHSRHPELSLSVEVSVTQTVKSEYDEIQCPWSDGKTLLVQDSPSLEKVESFMVSCVNDGKEDDIYKIGLQIGEMEKNLDKLNVDKAEIEEVLQKFQATIVPSLLNMSNELFTKEELMKQIESIGNSAAAIFCQLSREGPFRELHNHFMGDIVGLVALLGRVNSTKLSRVLSEYLGVDKMLAVVTRTFAAVGALEKYEQNGEVDRRNALYAEAAARGKTINGRFLVICLDEIRPYVGELEGSDPRKKLALENPKLADGATPRGFMGYAVNMVDLDINHLYTKTSAGHGLRETLLYDLFGELHVYETREDMIAARACCSRRGAVSLDGGILQKSGVISLGYGDGGICFPVETNNNIHMTSEDMELMKYIEVGKSRLRRIEDDIGKLTIKRDRYLKKFERKKKKFNELMNKYDSFKEN